MHLRLGGPALAMAMLALSGCYTYSSVQVASPLRPAEGSDQVGYLVGSLGNDKISADTPTEQQLQIRKRGTEQKAWARMMDNTLVHTRYAITQPEGGKASAFAIPLKPGEYELYNVRFDFAASARIWKKEEFSIPLTVEAGKAYYLGDFRTRCYGRASVNWINKVCMYTHSNQLARDRAIFKAEYPHLPELEAIELKQLQTAYPLIVESQDSQKALEQIQGGK